MISNRPLWWNNDYRLDLDTDTIPNEIDVVVVGAGLTGLITGYELVKTGRRVLIVDQQPLGHGASGRAFGSIAIGCSASLGLLTKLHGVDKAKTLWLESSSAADFFNQYISSEQLECSLHHGGHIKLAVSNAHNQQLRDEYQALVALLGEDKIQLLDGEQLADEIDTDAVQLGLLDEYSTAVNPYQLLLNLGQRFVELGGMLRTETSVSSIQRIQTNRFRVTFGNYSVQCNKVALATNGYTGGLLPWLQRRIFKVGSYMIATEPLNEQQRKIFNAKRRTYTTAFNFKNYFRLTADHRLVFGGRSNLAIERTVYKVRSELESSMYRYFPELGCLKVANVWGGNLGFTFDQTPHIGEKEGVYYAAGYCGRGIPTAVQFGSLLAGMIASGSANTSFLDIPFPTSVAYRKRAWFLPMVSSYYRFKDFMASR